MKLYSHPGSCSSAVHIVLLESGADFEVVKINLFGDRVLEDGRNFNDINPKGSVPVLELDNGDIVTEISAVLQYIADICPEAKLAPANGTMLRTRLQEWLSYLNSDLHMTLGLFFSPLLEGAMRDNALERLNKKLEYVDDYLGAHDYLVDDRFSVADAYLYVMTTWPAMVGVDISTYGNLKAYASRIAERESVRTAMKAPG